MSSWIPLKYQKIIAIIGIPVIIVAVVLGLTVCSPMTVVAQGTVLSISPQEHVQYGFTRPPNSEGATYGQFSADHGATLYVMTAAQFSNYLGGTPSAFISSTGQTNSGGLGYSGRNGFSNTYIKPPGQYYFMFYNAGSLTTIVTVTNALQVETC